MSKKLLFAACILVLLLSILTACAAGPTPTSKPSPVPTTTSPAAAPKPVVWGFPSIWPSATGHLDGLAMVDFANAVKQRSGGRLDIKIYWFGEIAIKPEDDLSAMKRGELQLAQTGGAYFTQVVEGLRLLHMPGLAQDMAGIKSNYELCQDWINKELEQKFDVRMLWTLPYPIAYIWLKNEVKSVFDLQGKKIRSGGTEYSKGLKLLNAVPVTMPSSETYEAVMRGTIDGKHGDLSTLEPQKFYEVTKYIYLLPLGNGLNIFPMSRSAFNALPKDVQDIVLDEGAKAQAKILKGMEPLAGLGKTVIDQDAIKFGESKGVKFWIPTQADIKKWQQLTSSIWDEYANEASPTGLQYLKKVMETSKIDYTNPKLPK